MEILREIVKKSEIFMGPYCEIMFKNLERLDWVLMLHAYNPALWRQT
jgi:hypothetical protein